MLFKRIILFATVFLAFLAPSAFADENQPNFIRDAEIENTIRAYATPLFQAAGLDPKAVSINILVDPTLNAFVAGGQNLFIHTGLLMRAESASQVIGVIAHETGHMAGGHIVRMQGELGNASAEAIVAMLLGAAVGVASGRGDVGSAIAMGGQSMVERNILAYSRENESAADQAGLKFLDATHQSARGMLQFMEILGDQELLVTTRQDPYVRTHPLTRDRVAFIRDWVAHSKWSNAPERPEFTEMFQRMRGKLFGFLEPPMRTLMHYKANDPSIEARYARAIAYYRKPDMAKAVPAIDALIAERPNDPYFLELKGQMLFENARGGEAIAPYRRAAALSTNPLIHVEFGQVLVEQNDPALLKEAIANLTAGVNGEPDNAGGWRELGIAYGKEGNDAMASYALAEEALLEGRKPDAMYFAVKAERALPKGGPIWLRIQDIKDRASQRK